MKLHELMIPELRRNPASATGLVRALFLLVISTVPSDANLLLSRSDAEFSQFTFESHGRVVGKGNDPQLGVRASEELFLLSVKERTLWLQTSADGGDSFDEGIRVSDGGKIASNSENTPLMVVRSMHEFYAVWTADDGHDHSSLQFARSMDWGKSFGKSIPVDSSGNASQSFFTLAVAPDGTVFVAWLDGRDRGQGKQGSSALYLARSVNLGQSFEASVRVALNVCPCCRPSIAFGENKTMHIGWRGVIDHDIRDIFIATSTDGGATFGAQTCVAEDNWQINGCPHSGPALATLGGRLFVAWHTVSGKRSRIYIAWSIDNGAHFSSKVEGGMNLLDPNHPRLVHLDDTLGLVFQARGAPAREAWVKQDVYFRQIDRVGALSPVQRLGHAIGSAKYPTLLFERPDRIFVAWTEGADEGQKLVLARGRLSAPKQVNSPRRATGGNGSPTAVEKTNDD